MKSIRIIHKTSTKPTTRVASASWAASALALVILLIVISITAQRSLAAPEPALVPQQGTWQLDIELHGEPRLISIQLPGDEQIRRYWYLPYTITNNTGQAVEFYPQFDLLTDTFQLSHAEVGVRKPVYDAIRQRYEASIPLLESQALITGKVLVGTDNARDSVAVFEDFDPNAGSVKVFITGLSNETVTVDHPTRTDEQGQPEQILLRKTLELQYQVPGDQFNPSDRVMLYQNRKWIMR